VATALGVVTTILVARVLGPEGRGLYAVAVAFGAIGVQLASLGLQTSNTYYVSRSRQLLPALVGNTLLVGAGAAILALTAWVIATIFPSIAPVEGLLLALALVWVPVGLLTMLFQNLLLGLQRVAAFNTVELLSRVLTVALILVALILGFDRPALLLGASLLAVAFAGAWATRQVLDLLDERPKASKALLRQTAAYGVKAYLGAFFAFALLRIDVLLVDALLTAKDTGYYSVAVSLADALYLLPAAAGTVVFARLSTIDDATTAWLTTRRLGLWVGAALLASAGAAAVVGGPLLRLLFGDEFSPAKPAFIALAGAMVFYGVNNIVSSFVASRGLPWFTVHVWVAAAVLNVVLNLAFIPVWGIVGSAVASLVCYALVLAAQLAYVRWKMLP